jgi:membrane associated rhomboid family serine protease
MNWLMRVSVAAFIISLGAWALIAVWTIVDVNELLLTWQRIAAILAVVSGLAMLALLVYRAWERLGR